MTGWQPLTERRQRRMEAGTMGLLMSDTTLLDPRLDETLRRWDGLGEWAFAIDGANDSYEYEAADALD